MKVLLLNDGMYDGMTDVKFPVIVDAEMHDRNKTLVMVHYSELVRVGACPDDFMHGASYPFVLGSEAKIIE